MPARNYIYPARRHGSGSPNNLSGKYKNGEAIEIGTVLQRDANGELIVAAADPLDIVGVALEPAASKPGWDAANSPSVITGRVQEVTFAVADLETVWAGRAENAAVITAPTQSNVGEAYGLVKSGDEWRIDLADAANKRVEIWDVDLTEGVFFFKFAPAALVIT